MPAPLRHASTDTVGFDARETSSLHGRSLAGFDAALIGVDGGSFPVTGPVMDVVGG